MRELSPREAEVLNKVSLGMNSEEIAASCNLSVETIKTHRKNLIRKLEAKNSSHAIRIGYETGIIKLP